MCQWYVVCMVSNAKELTSIFTCIWDALEVISILAWVDRSQEVLKIIMHFYWSTFSTMCARMHAVPYSVDQCSDYILLNFVMLLNFNSGIILESYLLYHVYYNAILVTQSANMCPF